MSFNVALTARSNVGYAPPAGLTFDVQDFGGVALGGFDMATINVNGPRNALRDAKNWLLYKVQIVDDGGRVLWDGFINEVELRIGGATVTLGVERLYNAVRVLYSFSSPDGGSDTAMTDWLVDADSINEFGRKELLHSAGGEVSQASAESLRANVLAAQKKPIPTMAVGRSDEEGATLYCYGRFRSLEWRYYEDATGYVAHEDNNGRILLGWGMTGSQRFGFVGDGKNRVLDFTGWLGDLQDGDYIRISGSASNNISAMVKSANQGGNNTYSADTISFSPGNDINDSGSGLGFARTYEGLKVTGSPNNDGYYLIGDVVTASHLEITTSFGASPIVSDSAGPTVRLDLAQSVEVDTALTHEIPSGSSVTVRAMAAKVAQSFTISDGPWNAGEIVVSIGKKNTPASGVTVGLYSNSGGNPGTQLASGTIAAADVPYDAGWVTCTLSSPVTLSNSTTYWIVIDYAGGLSTGDYYYISADTEAGYTSGQAKLYNGSAWVVCPTASDIPFQVWGVIESTAKIAAIVNAAATTFVTGCSIVTASGLLTRRKRDGKSSAWQEIQDLLEQGASTGRRLQAVVDTGGNLIVDVEPLPTLLDLIWRDDGSITYADGALLPKGVLPHGRWVQIDILMASGWTADMSGFLCDQATFSTESGDWQLTPKGAPDPYDLGSSQG